MRLLSDRVHVVFAVVVTLGQMIIGGQARSSGDNLAAWLASLVFEIPTMSFLEAGYNISIASLECTGTKVKHIATSEPAGDAFIINAAGEGLSVQCEGDWGFSAVDPILPWPRSGGGGVKIVIGDGSYLGGNVRLVMDNDTVAPLPAHIVSNNCSATLQISTTFSGGGLLNVLLKVFERALSALLEEALPKVICEGMDKEIGKLDFSQYTDLIRTIAFSDPGPPAQVKVSSGDKLEDWRPYGKYMRDVDSTLGNFSNALNLNSLMKRAANNSEGNLTILSPATPPVSISIPLPKLGLCNITLPDLSVSGLTSFSTLYVDNGTEASMLQAAIALDRFKVAGAVRLKCTPQGTVIKGHTLTEDFTFGLSLGNLSFRSLAEIALDKNGFVGQVLADPGTCLGGAVIGTQVQTLLINSTIADITLHPTSGGSMEQDVDGLIQITSDVFLRAMGPSISTLLYAVARGIGRNLLNLKLPDGSKQNTPCAKGEAMDWGTNYSLSDGALYTAYSLIGLAFVLSLVPRRILKRREARDVEIGSPDDSAGAAPAHGLPHGDSHGDAGFGHAPGIPADGSGAPAWDCLALHPRIGWKTAIGLPLAVVGNMGLFLAANFTVGVNVVMIVEAKGNTLLTPTLFQFDLLNSVRDMWNAGIYPLAIIIACFSGFWPYVKLLLMIVCWLMPKSRLSVRRRQQFLEFLDAYGKWSLIDSFVMVMFLVSFHFKFATDDEGIVALIGNVGIPADMEVRVEPQFGFNLFLAATILSLILGNLICARHRYAHQLGEYRISVDESDGASGQKVAVSTVVGASKTMTVAVACALSFSLLFLVIGVFVHSFAFVFKGAAGVLMGDANTRSFSLVSLGADMPTMSGHPSNPWIIATQVTFFMFSFVTVLAYQVVLLVLWLAPLSSTKHRHLLVACQTLQSWGAIDVFVVSLIAAVFQIDQLVKFIVGDKCDFLNKVMANPPQALRKFLPAGIAADPVCIDLDTVLQPGTILLFLAAVTSSVTGMVVLTMISRKLTQADEERNESIFLSSAQVCDGLSPEVAATAHMACGAPSSDSSRASPLLPVNR